MTTWPRNEQPGVTGLWQALFREIIPKERQCESGIIHQHRTGSRILIFRMSSEQNSEDQSASSGKDAVGLVDGPMEDEETAKQKLEEAGFRPDNFTEEEKTEDEYFMSPMIHFCFTGDLRMCRFLLTKGASTTESCEDGSWFPLMA